MRLTREQKKRLRQPQAPWQRCRGRLFTVFVLKKKRAEAPRRRGEKERDTDRGEERREKRAAHRRPRRAEQPKPQHTATCACWQCRPQPLRERGKERERERERKDKGRERHTDKSGLNGHCGRSFRQGTGAQSPPPSAACCSVLRPGKSTTAQALRVARKKTKKSQFAVSVFFPLPSSSLPLSLLLLRTDEGAICPGAACGGCNGLCCGRRPAEREQRGSARETASPVRPSLLPLPLSPISPSLPPSLSTAVA